ncbi:MAG TPA: Ig-like domain-containing protein [Acidimicrobiales bacterium]
MIAAVATTFALAGTAAATGTGVGQSGNTVPGAAAAQGQFTAGTPFDSGQQIDVVIPPNQVLTPGATIFVLECAAPNGVNPTTINVCDGNSNYGGGTITVNSDGSVDVMNSSTTSGNPYIVYALPDHYTFRESPSTTPKCGLGAANECVLYIGQGGGNDVGLSQPHFFSQPFQIHTDPTDSGTLNPGDGSPQPVSSVSSSLSTVTPATQSVTADGQDRATVTVTLNDASGVAVAGKTVTLTAANGQVTVVPTQSGSNVTNAAGKATFAVTDNTAESVTLDAADSTDAIPVTATAQVTFTPETLNQTASTVTANPTTVPSDGSTPSTITVSLRDNESNGGSGPLIGRTVTLVGESGSSVVVPASAGSNITDANGIATFDVTDGVGQAVTFQATDTTDSGVLTSTATVTFGVAPTVSASASTISASPATVNIGPSGTSVTVTLLASNGTTAIPGKSVDLAVSSPSGHASIVGSNPSVSDAAGQAKFQVDDTTAESVTITATDVTDSNLTLTANDVVVFIVPPPPTVSPTLSTVTVSGGSVPADGFTEAVATVTVINTNGITVSGATVTMSGAPNATVSVQPLGGIDTTNSSGVVQFAVRDTTAEAVTLTTVVGGITLAARPTATFVAGVPDGVKSTVSASPTKVPADGSTTSTVTVTLTDYFGNPIAGKTVDLTASSGSSVITPVQLTSSVLAGVTNTGGQTAFNITDGTTEVVIYTASDPADSLTLAQLVSVTFGTPPIVVPVKADSSIVTSASSVVADGKTVGTITVELRDANGFPVTGKTVSLTASSGSSVITAAGSSTPGVVTAASTPHTAATNSNGNAVFNVTDTVSQTVTYTAADTTDSISGWAVVVAFTTAPPTTTTTTTSTTSPGTAAAANTSTTSGGSSADTSTGATGQNTSGTSDTSGDSGTTASTGLAFTGAPTALPWILGIGVLLLLLGVAGRRIRLFGRRER